MGSFRGREADWLGVHEALDCVLSGVTALEAEIVSLDAALGRVLATDVTAGATLPPWDNAAMDGYAVRSADLDGAAPESPVRLTVVGRAHAGERHDTPLAPGHAVRIMTGAPVPPGADGVVRVEDTDAEEGTEGEVAIFSSRDAGRNIRPGGRDMRAGDTVLEAGTTVGPGAVAVLAAAGRAEVTVTRRPRVAIVTTGDELAPVDAFARVARGEAIPESNGPMLAAAVAQAGGEPRLLPVAPDDTAILRARLQDALGSSPSSGDPEDHPSPPWRPDLLLTVGGASMGEADLLKDVLEALGMELDFWRVRIRPGSPVSLGRIGGGLPVLSLPGNPASAFVTFHLFARPLIRSLLGASEPHLPTVEARAGEALRSVGGLCHFHRVKLEQGTEGAPRAHLTGPQGSGLVSGLGTAQALAVVPEGVTEIASGEPVTCLRLDASSGGRADAGYRSTT